MRNRHINVECFLGDACAFLGPHHAERSHVMHAVGKLHENHSNVARHCKEHFAEAFCLRYFVRGEAKLVELGDAVDELGDVRAEFLRHFALARARILKYVVHEARFNGFRVHAPRGKNGCDGNGVRNVGLARLAELAEVRVVGVAIGFSNFFDFVARQVKAAGVDQTLRSHDDVWRLGREERQIGIGKLFRNKRPRQRNTMLMLRKAEGRNGLTLRSRHGLSGQTVFLRGVHVVREKRRCIDGHEKDSF